MKRRTVFTMLVAALLVVCGFGLVACGGLSPEQAIRQTLEEEFEDVKSGKGNSDLAESLTEEFDGDLDSYGIDSEEFSKAYLEGFDYKIGDITVDEQKGSATAEVSITMKPIMEMIQSFTVRMLSAASELPEDATEDDYNALTGKIMMEELSKLEPKTVDTEIIYNKNSDGDWEPDEQSVNKAFTAAALGTSDASTIEAFSALAEQGSAQ
ncbi:MAG: hypothetical protein SOY67_01905 [Collinsella sp.]|nr:hypothetical protein [Collinsella sp.]